MKRMISFILAIFVVLSLAGQTTAKEVFVTSLRDGYGTYWDISSRVYGTGLKWKEIHKATGTDPRKLRIGQIVIVPDNVEIDIKNHNTSPYGASPEKGSLKVLDFIQKLKGVDQDLRIKLSEAVRSQSPEKCVLRRGEKAIHTTDARGVYGNGKMIFTFNWTKAEKLSAWQWRVIVQEKEYRLVVIEQCGNATLMIPVEKPAPKRINKLPTAVIDYPESDLVIFEKEVVSFEGHGADEDGYIVAHEWKENSCYGKVISSEKSLQETLPLGSHRIYFSVQDNDGDWSINCPSRTIIVKPQFVEEVTKEKLTDDEKFFMFTGTDIEAYASIGRTLTSYTNIWRHFNITWYPLTFLDGDYQHKLGGGYKYNDWWGESEAEDFEYEGRRQLVKLPSYKFINPIDHRDFGMELLFGKEKQKGWSKDQKYESNSRFDLVGLGAFGNFYAREEEGERWWPKTQIWGSVLKVTGKEASHSWDGYSIADTSDLENFDWAVDVGVRQYIYDFDWLRTYGLVGYTAELDFYESLNAMLGVSDIHDIIFLEAGWGFDLKSGGDPTELGNVGVDITNLVSYGVGKIRKAKVRMDAEEKHGVKMIEVEKGGAFIPVHK